MDLGLKGKRAVVTGGNRGIGRCCALALAREGSRVCIGARDQARSEAVVQEIDEAGGEGRAVAVDLTSQAACEELVGKTVSAFGGIDILINCAGAAMGGDILSLPVTQIDNALALKSYGYLRLSQLVIPHMREQKWGRIVNIAGAAGANPTQGNIPMSIANITILNMTRALSDAVAGDGILDNPICPGLTNTNRPRTLQKAQAEKEGRTTDEVLNAIGQNLPAGRIAEPEEIASAVAFLASEPCSYVFGSSLYMDGGERRGTP